MEPFNRFYNEADNMKFYLSGVNRSSSNLDQIKSKILDFVSDIIEKNNFIIEERSRANFGYDFEAHSRSTQTETFKTSFGDVVAIILSSQILSSDTIKNNILNGGQEKFKNYLKQVEDFVSDPKNSSKVSRLVAKLK